MKKLMIMACLVAMMGLSACQHMHPRHPHDGNFCPPGQAKKGHCV
ncbi:MAG TPA: hypothetical protein VGD95_04905 [Micavibrio sp.]